MSASNTAFPLGMYVGTPNGNDPAAEQDFESQYNSFVQTMGGARPMFMNSFVDFGGDPSTWGASASWNAWSWAQSGNNYVGPGTGVTPVVGVPMSTNDGGWSNIDQFYQQIISGQYDADYKGIVDGWAQQGYNTIDLRLGYEFNGTFMPWSPYDTSSPNAEADFVTAWQHLADVVHAAGRADGVTVNTVWNPNVMAWTQTPTPSLYPGDQYVDIISADLYSHTWPADLTDWASGGTTQDSSATQWASQAANRAHYWQYPDASFWNPTGTGSGWSLQNTIDFAKAHGKPVSLSETGAGGDGAGLGPVDEPAFPQWLAGDLSNAQAEGVPVAYVNIWDITMGDGDWLFSGPGAAKPQEAAAWGQYFGAGSGGAASSNSSGSGAATSSNSSGSDPATSSNSSGSNGGSISNGDTIGTGADTLVLSISEDRYANGDGSSDSNGDATFVVLVDGQQVGGTLTATAMHAQGQTEQFTVLGNFGPGNHTVEAQLSNDAWSGVPSPTTDRNIYVDGATYNGATINYTGMDYNGDGAWFAISGGTPPATADDTLVLNLSADLWQGNPQFIVSVDGQQQGGPQSVTALNDAGQTQAFDFTGTFGPGTHDIAVSFVNDAYGGTPQTDRNLYVNSIDYNGQHYAADTASLFSNGTAHFTVG